MKRRALGIGLLALLAGLGAAGVAGARKPLAVVVDIDSTITDPRFQRKIHQKVPLPRAAEVLSRAEASGISVIYLSKRRVRHRSTTIWWLGKYGFPPGREVIHRENPAEPGLDFKIREINRLKKEFEIVCAIGNGDEDRSVYSQTGLFAVIREVWNDEEWVKAGEVLERIIRSRSSASDRKEE